MKKLVVVAIGAGLLFTLCACQALAQSLGFDNASQAAQAALGDMLDNGQITQDQFQALSGALVSGDTSDFRNMLLGVGLSVAGSLTGVRVWRGGVNARKGAVAS